MYLRQLCVTLKTNEVGRSRMDTENVAVVRISVDKFWLVNVWQDLRQVFNLLERNAVLRVGSVFRKKVADFVRLQNCTISAPAVSSLGVIK